MAIKLLVVYQINFNLTDNARAVVHKKRFYNGLILMLYANVYFFMDRRDIRQWMKIRNLITV